jgi:hypothetical protein
MSDKYLMTDFEGLVKDPNSGAVLSVDNDRLKAYKKQKAAFETTRDSSKRLDKLENDMSDIKQMLQQLLTR